MFHLMIILAVADTCTKTISVDLSKPIVVKEKFTTQGTVCINSSQPNLAIVLEYENNDYSSLIFRTISPRAETFGPYKTKDEIGGFYFGKSTGSIEIKFDKEGDLNFGVIAFPSVCEEMILSNKMQNEVKITNDKNKEPITGFNKTLCYWQFSAEEIKYEVKVETQKDHDFLTFVRDGTANVTYSGEMKDEFSVYPSTSSYAVWESDSSIESSMVRIYSRSANYNYKAIKQYFKQSEGVLIIHYKYFGLTDGEIAGIVCGVLIAVLIILIIICACCGCCCACCYSCCCCCWCKNVKRRRCCRSKKQIESPSTSSGMESKEKAENNECTPPIMSDQVSQPNPTPYAPQYPVYPQYVQTPQNVPVYPPQNYGYYNGQP